MPILVRWTTIYPESLSIAKRPTVTSGHKSPRRAAYISQYVIALQHVIQIASTTKRSLYTPDAHMGNPADNRNRRLASERLASGKQRRRSLYAMV
jgi:hypothetical protein